MRSGRFIIQLLVGGLMLALLPGGCVREQNQEDLTGQPVCFDAYSTPDAPGTKTSFSGVTNAGIERIDWEIDDRIRVACREVAWPATKRYDYYLAPDYNSGKLSFATLNPHGSAHGLLWGKGSHTFYALYPSPTGSETAFTMEEGYAMARVTLPADQSYETARTTDAGGRYYGNMKLAYMLAANVVSPTSDRVVLAFFPIVTTFYVTITNTTGAGMTLRRVELTSSDSVMQGTYEAVIREVTPLAEGDLPTTTTRNFTPSTMYSNIPFSSMSNSIYATFDGLFVAPGNSVTVALFAVPFGTTGSNITKVTLSVTSDETGTVSRLLTEGSPASPSVFAAGKKHNVTNIQVPAVDYDIHVDEGATTVSYGSDGVAGAEQTFHVTSTKSVVSNTTAAPWKTQIRVSHTGNALVDWVDMTTANRPSWLSNYPLTSDDVDGITAGGRATIQRNVSAPEIQSHVDHLKEGKIYEADGVTEVDNSINTRAVDLSYYDFVTHRMEATRTTANTYIISAPGWYKFPLVYGNAIENNVDPVANTYTGLPVGLIGDTGHLNNFKKAKASATSTNIGDPWLEDGYYANAMLLWQKFTRWENNEAVTQGAHLRAGGSDNLQVITNLGVIIEGAKPYITFYVNPNNIQPGCAAIASVGSSFLTWSWLIWITDQNMEPVNVTNSTNNYDVMPVNLGWTDDTKGLYYPESTATLRFVNMAGGIERAISEEVIVRQSSRDVASTSGWQPYYQWGRKEPFVPGLFTYYGHDDEIHDVLQNPDWLYASRGLRQTYDWSQNNYNNLWDSQWNNYGTLGTSLPDMKTVYDPSPRKYCVSPENAWDSVTTSGSFNKGYYLNTGHGTTLFFPASGYLQYSDGTVQSEGVQGRYWTNHAIGSSTTRTSYSLSFLNGALTPPSNGTAYDRAYAFAIRPVRYQ